MDHLHLPSGDTLGKPTHRDGDRATVGSHTGEIVTARPYGTVPSGFRQSLPADPANMDFERSWEDVVIKPD